MPTDLAQEVDVMTFDELWSFATRNGEIVQEKIELNFVYDLMKACDCKSYLEIGSAEGNSLYVLGHVVEKYIDYIDYGEAHTTPLRDECVGKLKELGKNVTGYLGDSTNAKTLPNKQKYDCVLIDGGHDYETVLSDCMMYAGLATKYVFFHDVQLKPVADAIEFYLKRWPLGKYTTFINSPTYGYGILEVLK